MSEYQSHEWQCVDRVLTAAEQEAVDQLSSHIEVSPGYAIVTYNWGNFKHDPRQALRKRLAAFLPPRERPQTAKPRSLRYLLRRAGEIEKAEQKRQAEEARRAHIAEMEALAAREAQTWRQVDELLDEGRRIASVYDEATALLAKLEQLYDFQHRSSIFQSRLRSMAEKYAARGALIDRWRKKRWV